MQLFSSYWLKFDVYVKCNFIWKIYNDWIEQKEPAYLLLQLWKKIYDESAHCSL